MRANIDETPIGRQWWLLSFARTAQDKTDKEALMPAELLQVVQETMQAKGAAVWLKE